MNTKRLKLFVLAIIAIFIICALASCKTSEKTGLQIVKETQKENTFSNRMETNESFTLGSYRDDLKYLKDKIKEAQKGDITEAKKAKLLKEIEALRARL